MSLVTVIDGQRVLTAGIPWYVAPFGRDALLTAYEMLMLNPTPARDTLLFLAQHQAAEDDGERDAEPGKILHEMRVGELARAGYIPHTPYYGTIDATPLFMMLAAAYYRWTADTETMVALLPAFDAALEWMDRYGDRDGDGFLEYKARSRTGLNNQGWKDSEDAVVNVDGSLAEPPIALVEVQGYAYLAKERIAEVFEALGQPDRADQLRKEAAELKLAFNEAFWMEDEGTYALALDGNKRQVRSVTSNPGHCLSCSIADPDKARRAAERLMADDMFSGWGVRTLSAHSPAYNPVSYHNGSVWPHDNAIIAAGLKRYGMTEGAERIVSALFDAAYISRDARLPELLCGFDRQEGDPYVPYPVACRPQAWAAAAPLMILQALLGISARAPERLLTINQPQLPDWLGSLEIRNLRVGDASMSLAFTRSQGVTAVSLLERSGDARISIHED
jgi:glycogen debranching enzyme